MGEFLAKILKGQLGWKTLLAAATLVVLVALNATGVIDQGHFDQCVKIAEALGLVGLRDALSKLPA